MRPGFSAARYLASRTRLGIKLGLDQLRLLLAELGQPEAASPALLVAGTNGKGSVVAYVDAALRASGLRVGRYTSPHLVSVRERIAVDGRSIAPQAFERAVGAVREAAQRLVAEAKLKAHPTHFEVLTAAAFVHFRRMKVDVAVLEVGLGGRWDATNVSEPLASAIVTIALDHQEHLGGTLARIAAEKAGVLRPGRVTVLGPVGAAARRTIEARARSMGARLVRFDAQLETAARGELLDVTTGERSYRGLRPLPGRHQRENLIVALRLLEAASQAGLPVRWRAVAAATWATRWPGRLQELKGRPRLLLDGAHNPAAARALGAELRTRRPFTLVFGAMRDKDLEGLARPLFPLAERVLLTRVRNERAATPQALAERCAAFARGQLEIEPSVPRALVRAERSAGPAGLVVVAGSLYLVGEVLAYLARRQSR